MNEINIFLQALKSVTGEDGAYIPRLYYTPTSIKAIKTYTLEIFIINNKNKTLLASASRNYNVSTTNHSDLYVDIMSQILKYYGVKQISNSN